MADAPTTGGSYTRSSDGSLKLLERTEDPQASEATPAPAATPAKRKDDK
ncbi:hypothetical protein [Rhizobium sp. NFR12]|nr:hypothetical protein [Rhizobium sp. NFR12]SEH22532.1 hypothetical protein SAMN03159407_1173 [Rhizobium sp. NFR12]